VIVGLGIDIVDIDRFMATLARSPALIDRLFSADELGVPDHSLAARFAAKEALAKSLGAPGDLRWHDVHVAKNVHGDPDLVISGSIAARAAAIGADAFHLSMSHDGGMATAIVIAERRRPAE